MLTDEKPDLVIFDVDGTLQDTFQWWPRVVNEGLRVASEAWGCEIDPVEPEAACRVVGFKGFDVWGTFLPESHQHRWEEFRELVVPIEVAEVRSGRDYLFAGVRELLRELRGIGVRTALASNCGHRYFGAICEGQGLGELTDWQFCLDSPGVQNKTDMLRCALEAAGTPRAVMVGDREPDHHAAREIGLPFVWRVNDRCELEDADGRWHGQPEELLGLLGLPRIS